MYPQSMLVFLVGSLLAPFLAAQAKLEQLPSAAAEGGAFCSRVGEVLGQDVFAQTFLIKQDDGQTETIPFSRWTEVFKILPDSSRERSRAIEPTDIRFGARLCVLLDPSEATATLILVLHQLRAPVKVTSVRGRAATKMTALVDPFVAPGDLPTAHAH
jgi:hypothetical protein